MRTRFMKPNMRMTDKYDGYDDPRAHLAKWAHAYGEKPQPEWVHLFCHTKDIVPDELVCRNRALPWYK